MPGRVYSTRFLLGFVSSTATDLTYTVPAGKLAVIRDASFTSDVAFRIGLAGGPGASILIGGAENVAAGWAFIRLNLNTVINPGEVIKTTWFTSHVHVQVSGYLLTLT